MRLAPSARMRVSSLAGLLGACLALPLFVVACGPADGDFDGESDGQRDDGVTENANDKIAFDYFVDRGLTPVQAAGIIGNLDQESGMSPTIKQSGGGPGRGIAQWSVGERWDSSHNDNVAWYAAQQGDSIYSLDLQLDFIWYELTTFGYGYSKLRAATTVTQAVEAFQDYYEICGACDSSNRIAHAQAALAKFGGDSPSPPPPSGPTSCTVNGVKGTCIDTGACAAMTGYTSHAGYCAGASNIECCTQASSQPPPPPPPPATTCSVNGVSGTCIDTGACAAMAGYTSHAGYCPGAANIECCTPPPSCSVSGVGGVCISTSACAAEGHTSHAGYCPGAANIQCCTP